MLMTNRTYRNDPMFKDKQCRFRSNCVLNINEREIILKCLQLMQGNTACTLAPITMTLKIKISMKLEKLAAI